MEVTLHIGTPAEANATLAEALTWESSAKLRPLLDALAPLFEGLEPTRSSYGAEFCEHLLPTPEALSAVRQACRRPFTFLTPYVGDQGLQKLKHLLPHLLPGDEVIFSDWGVLNILQRDFPHLLPVQGRLLNKSIRDPRIMGLYAEAGPGPSLTVLQGSNLDNRAYTAMLQRFGVQRAEIDGLPQGNDLAITNLQLTACLPYGFISTARVCQAAGLGYRKAEKFQPAAPCRQECQTFLLEHAYTNSPFANQDQKFWLRGNSYFYIHTPAIVKALVHAARQGSLARLHLQPRLPMLANGVAA
jgi:hypothetical protein